MMAAHIGQTQREAEIDDDLERRGQQRRAQLSRLQRRAQMEEAV
jgi:hypothetical protein